MSVVVVERPGTERERGYVLLTVAVTMVVIMLFVAVVIDVGQVMLQRSNDQSAADLAVLGAVGDRYNEPNLKATVVDILNRNIDGANFTAADLNTCAAEPLPAGWTTYPTAICLAHDYRWSQIRLRIPVRTIDTSFALLGGVRQIEHTAFAEARAVNSVAVLPFAIPANAGAHQCLKVGTGSLPDNLCDRNSSGNFGDLDFTEWGNPSKGTTVDCTGTTQQYDQNIAQGVDHELSRYTLNPFGPYVADAEDRPACPWRRPTANSAATSSGNQPSKAGDGFFAEDAYADGGPARLRRLSSVPWFTTTTINNELVDDTPLWEFLDAALGPSDHVPRSCYKNQFVGDAGALNPDNDIYMTNVPIDIANYLLVDNTFSTADRTLKMMERCLLHYQNIEWDDDGNFTGVDSAWPTGCTGHCTDPLFTRDTLDEDQDVYDIQTSPRFAYVPRLFSWSSFSDHAVPFKSFSAIYLQRLYTERFVFDPGVGFAGYNTNPRAQQATAVSAFVFPPGSLPRGLASDGAVNSIGGNVFVELTR